MEAWKRGDEAYTDSLKDNLARVKLEAELATSEAQLKEAREKALAGVLYLIEKKGIPSPTALSGPVCYDIVRLRDTEIAAAIRALKGTSPKEEGK